jgi:hypothetical protein
MEQVVQVLGALLILAAFVLSQRRVVSAESLLYLVPNLVGSAALAVDAWLGSQWGFVLLESAWAAVSAAGLTSAVVARRARRGPARRAPRPRRTQRA